MRKAAKGFTLIELAIVLVIIGLIVGGVLVGRDLITAAEVRAQISQIEKYQQAVNTFRGKYDYLPGDIPEPHATQFGFIPRDGPWPGGGNGDGINHGNGSPGAFNAYEGLVTYGEAGVFWVDLSTAKLIDTTLSTSNFTENTLDLDQTLIPLYLPQAKIRNGNTYVYNYAGNNQNYFGITNINDIIIGFINSSTMTTPLTASQAHAIDKKTDDSLPQTGNIFAAFLVADQNHLWTSAANSFFQFDGPYTTAAVGSSTTCFDNGNNAGETMKYSITQNNGNGQNCALSFKFH